MEDQNLYLEHILNSREFTLGSRLRQSFPFKLVRRLRFKDRMVQLTALGAANSRASAAEVCLLGVWYEDFPHGMPLDFMERDPKKWRMVAHPASPFGKALLTTQKDTLCVYSQHENLRLDFRMDRNSGMIRVEVKGRYKVIDLYSPNSTIVSVYPNQGRIETQVKDPALLEDQDAGAQVAGNPILLQKRKFTVQDQQWLEQHYKNSQPISVNNPDWRGILASAQEMFDNVFLLPDDLDRDRAFYYAELFREANCPLIVIQGLPRTYHYLIRAVRKTTPHIPVYAIYHGNFLHMREEYEWAVFKTIKDLHASGDIAKVGFVKKGMAEIMSSTGMKSAFIMNLVRRIPDAPSQPLADGVHVAIWGLPDWSWKKSPYAMQAALMLVPGAIGHVYNVSPRAHEFGDLMGIHATYTTEAIPNNQVIRTMSQMHLNLYVTLTECAPMMPLESLSVGTPCLFGPTTHYFLDHEYLRSRLVVPSPDHAEVIAEKVNLTLAERSQVIEAYRVYAPDYNHRAFQALSEFLEYPMGAVS